MHARIAALKGNMSLSTALLFGEKCVLPLQAVATYSEPETHPLGNLLI